MLSPCHGDNSVRKHHKRSARGYRKYNSVFPIAAPTARGLFAGRHPSSECRLAAPGSEDQLSTVGRYSVSKGLGAEQLVIVPPS